MNAAYPTRNGYPTANASLNGLSQHGVVPNVGIRRTAQIVNTIVPASTTLPISQAGEAFYIIAASGPVQVRPSNGAFNTYYTGTGIRADANANFDMLEVRNSTAHSITISIWVGFGEYVDNRVILVSDLFFSVIYPTYPVPNAASNILIPDRSGSAILDINGNSWLALNRISLQITNFDTANAMPIKDTANAVGSVLACLPNTSLIMSMSGDYRITIGATALNCIVSETYNAIQPTLGP